MMLQICLWITSYEVYGLVAAKLSWVDPAIFAAIESDTYLLYFTKLSGKSQDFYFLVGIHLKLKPGQQKLIESVQSSIIKRIMGSPKRSHHTALLQAVKIDDVMSSVTRNTLSLWW